jgi:hypothetical protein
MTRQAHDTTDRRRSGSVILLPCILLLAGAGLIGALAGDDNPNKPKIKLIAEPMVGFTPVTAVLTGQISGISPGDAAFCHPAVTWVRINPGLREDDAMRYHQDAACRHPESEAIAVTSFTKTLTLYQPGNYLFKLIVEGHDGRKVESAYTKVQVLRVQ